MDAHTRKETFRSTLEQRTPLAEERFHQQVYNLYHSCAPLVIYDTARNSGSTPPDVRIDWQSGGTVPVLVCDKYSLLCAKPRSLDRCETHDESAEVCCVTKKKIAARQYQYVSIADDIRQTIQSGQLPPGSLLPPETQLSERYSVSRLTVRKSLSHLREEGLIDARQGYGWTVVHPAPVRRSLAIGSYEDSMVNSGVRVEWRILNMELQKPDGRVGDRLDCERVLFIKRLTERDGLPAVLLSIWIPESLSQSLTAASVQSGSFSQLIGEPIERAVQSFRAKAADDEEADVLQIPVGSPVMHSERVSENAKGKAIAVSEAVYPADQIEFVVDVPAGISAIIPNGQLPQLDDSTTAGGAPPSLDLL